MRCISAGPDDLLRRVPGHAGRAYPITFREERLIMQPKERLRKVLVGLGGSLIILI